mmetsp:Transcript_104433/g.336592  ORF Transcript_104433/g.336592 Transcript_104433/m.336592 type:complete len:288 (+) Transcript_104433:225-1088(+)
MPLAASEAVGLAENPHVHHDLASHVRDGDATPGLLADFLSVDVPCDACWKPLEGIGVEVRASVRRRHLPALLNALLPPIGVVGRQHVGGDRSWAFARDLKIDLAPVLVLGVTEDKHRRDEVAVDVGVAGLHTRSLHANLIPAVAENVVARAELAAAQRLVRNVGHLRVRARLRIHGRRRADRNLHLAALEQDVLLLEAHLPLGQAAVGPRPDGVRIQIDRAVELLHQHEREARVGGVAGSGGRMAVELARRRGDGRIVPNRGRWHWLCSRRAFGVVVATTIPMLRAS